MMLEFLKFEDDNVDKRQQQYNAFFESELARKASGIRRKIIDSGPDQNKAQLQEMNNLIYQIINK